MAYSKDQILTVSVVPGVSSATGKFVRMYGPKAQIRMADGTKYTGAILEEDGVKLADIERVNEETVSAEHPTSVGPAAPMSIGQARAETAAVKRSSRSPGPRTVIPTKQGDVRVTNTEGARAVVKELVMSPTLNGHVEPRVGIAQQEMLAFLRKHQHAPVSFRHIASHFDMKPARVATVIKSLEQKNLVKRFQNAKGPNSYEVL